MSDMERLKKEIRVKEYTEVFQRNLADPYIKSMHVLCEDNRALEYFSKIASPFGSKAVFTVLGHQPTYKELMEYVKRTFSANELVCVMNGDIYFRSGTDHELIKKHLHPNFLFALTRHEITDEGHTLCNLQTCPFTGGGSCDTFIFYTPVSDAFDMPRVDFRQNLFGAENVFMKAWQDIGYEIWNPCGDIVTLHLHAGRIHFERYDTIDTPTNSILNLRTALPTPSHRDI